jgi:preprotein translocase subunit SecD
MRNLRLYLTFLAIVLIAAFAVYIDLPKGSKIDLKKIHINYTQAFPPHLGLDLVGGTYLEYQGDLSKIPAAQQGSAMDAARTAIQRRIASFNVEEEPVVQTSGTDHLIVELPGITNISQAISVIGQTPFLQFETQNPNPGATPVTVDASGHAQVNVAAQQANQWIPTGLTGADLTSASVQFDPTSGAPTIALQFNAAGTQLFSQITSANINKPVAIFLDGSILSNPTVDSAITNGQAIISGQFTVDQAKQLASSLNAGALPVPLTLVDQENVGATLGRSSIEQSMLAGLIGLILIAVFMIVYYRFPGLLAVFALAIYALLSFAILKIGISVVAVILVGAFFFLGLTYSWVFGVLAVVSYLLLMFLGGLSPVTITLEGIAGFILSIGMAVDANILIFERTKEELRLGKDVDLALDDGFNRAWPSIRDSNISSLITTLILYVFGTAEIKSFAVTLAIGIIISLFTAITVTKTFLRMFVGHNILAHPWLFGVSKQK